MKLKTIEWIADTNNRLAPGRVRSIDQTALPVKLTYIDTRSVDDIWNAIKELKVRGAPAIGVAAAMGVVLAAQERSTDDVDRVCRRVHKACEYLASSRPTAVNLFRALDRMKTVAELFEGSAPDLVERLACEAVAICEEDAAQCEAIGEHGLMLLKDSDTVLTHCNAGSLATARYGTALAPVYKAREKGMKISVYADETRPLLQGSRLTAWELMQEGIEVTLICDSVAAEVMKEGKIDLVMVGADRIAANGDAANKIGTYGLAVLAKHHGIPFYILAPTTSFDLSISSGDEIPIEERAAEEVVHGFGKQTAPDGVAVYTPAFDVTPAELITAIVCEKGVFRPPFALGDG
ncbi:MAG: S-methyl-5-thioribose-1-phosphate isomerase [Verrucomicrobia bacterium]|nr:S-methyl-5-thioribose-1-phosphate isomerase [Verrucomicrobiota bacterium]